MSVYRTVELVVSKIYVQQNSSQSNNSGIKKNLLISGGFRGAHAGFSFGISVLHKALSIFIYTFAFTVFVERKMPDTLITQAFQGERLMLTSASLFFEFKLVQRIRKVNQSAFVEWLSTISSPESAFLLVSTKNTTHFLP